MSLRESYDLPKGPGLAGRMWIVMAGMAGVVLVLWLVLPASAVTVAVTFVALAGLVGTGVARALTSRQAQEPPPRRPERAPTEPHQRP
ncbi:MAG TPA: hypothetical protein VGV40_01900 [Solirubrobacteraceae bacterium]|nr:hypothetical protein [Solirubrobacteraceae bacterium]